jgi:hypothetical protein
MSRSLPARPSLAQLKRQANELHQAHGLGKAAAAARIAAHHPRFRNADATTVLDGPFALADAQLVIAREYGSESWAALKHRVELAAELARFTPHPRFADAESALRNGDLGRLRALLDAHPELVHARTNLEPPYGYFTAATLLHHVAWNPGQEKPVPSNIIEMTRLLLERGADPNAVTLGPSAGTTMGLIVTSRMASEANVSGPLMDLLLKYGARLDLENQRTIIPGWGDQDIFTGPLANHAPRAAEKLIELGAKPDVIVAAALGRMDLLRPFFDAEGRLLARPRRNGKRLSARDAIGLANLFAYVNRHSDVVDFLLEKDGNWDMTGVNNGTVMHRAAWEGNLEMVKRLVANGADIHNRDNPFNSTPLSWAQHNKQQAVFDWLRANCAIDIHDAVGHNLREHVEARVREDPACVNRQLDHWETPRSTPLYWAAWTSIHDVDGAHAWNESDRLELVRFLLDHGADPNLVAGDGSTPLDVATSAGAPSIVALLKERGGKRGAEL